MKVEAQESAGMQPRYEISKNFLAWKELQILTVFLFLVKFVQQEVILSCSLLNLQPQWQGGGLRNRKNRGHVPITGKKCIPIGSKLNKSALTLTEFVGFQPDKCPCVLYLANKPFSKMVAKNSNKSKLNTYASTKKEQFTLVTLQSFSISGVMSAEKM